MMMQSAHDLWKQSRQGTLALIDVRATRAHTNAHVPGSVSAPYSRNGWGRAVADWLRSQSLTRVGILADNHVVGQAAHEALRAEAVAVEGVLDGGPPAWEEAGFPIVSVPDVTADDLARNLRARTVLDVREPYEWRSGIVPGALTIPMGQLVRRIGELDKTMRYAVICASGNRSQQAAAYLADEGFQVENVRGGMALWLAGRHPVDYPRD
jgi:rhodanese-related sulfurtransferase